jgi:hypothetical protein
LLHQYHYRSSQHHHLAIRILQLLLHFCLLVNYQNLTDFSLSPILLPYLLIHFALR